MCTYSGNRDEALIAYLYEDGDAGERAGFAAHVASCAACRAELDALGGVRAQLARWSPPEPGFAIGNPQSAIRNPQWRWWRDVPVWAQVAAAMLFLGVSAGIANLDVRYDANGLSVRTGWNSPRSPVTSPKESQVARHQPPPGTGDLGLATVVTREDLVALEGRLQSELRAVQARTAAVPQPRAVDGDVLRRVQALIDRSEKREKSELALRIAQAMTDVGAQRQADLARIDRTVRQVHTELGTEVINQRAEVAKQRQSLNILLTSLRQ